MDTNKDFSLKTYKDFLLIQLMEECGEVVQRVAKIFRFGMDEIQPHHSETNKERLSNELHDLGSTIRMLNEEGLLEPFDENKIEAKKRKVLAHMEYSRERG